jgi:hypothetical protein
MAANLVRASATPETGANSFGGALWEQIMDIHQRIDNLDQLFSKMQETTELCHRKLLQLVRNLTDLVEFHTKIIVELKEVDERASLVN